MPRRQTDLVSILMLAPAVVALRLPTLMAEATASSGLRPETGRAVAEKAAALAEGVAAAQMAFFAVGTRTAVQMATGAWRPWFAADASAAAFSAALKPVARAVRANHRRLNRIG